MSRWRGRLGKLLETYRGREVSPVIAAIARNHVPEECQEDFLDFVWTGCSVVQLQMIIRYMGGTRVPIGHIEIEETKGELHATAQFAGGLNYMGDSVMVPATLPETLMMALVGRPLSALVDHPLLPGDEVITAIRSSGIGNYLVAEFGRRDTDASDTSINQQGTT